MKHNRRLIGAILTRCSLYPHANLLERYIEPLAEESGRDGIAFKEEQKLNRSRAGEGVTICQAANEIGIKRSRSRREIECEIWVKACAG